MDANLNGRLDYELMMLEYQKQEYASRLELLSDCKNSSLRRACRPSGKAYYYVKRPGASSYNYIGPSSHREVVRICEERFLEEALRRIDHNIDLVSSLINNYLPLDSHYINDSLPIAYRSDFQPISEMYRDISTKWLEKQICFQKGFPENYPENKRHQTSDGIMVKTLSEMLIYERFKAAGLTLVYELPFAPKDHGPALYPDFAVLSPIDFESVIFVEYVGRMDLQQYREGFAKKVGRYIDSGYIPGVNLFFIFSDKDGNIDSFQITKVIADILGKRTTQLS